MDEKDNGHTNSTPLAYGECRACAWGGPACVGKEKAWPLLTERQVVLAGKGKLKCPKCGTSDSGIFNPDAAFMLKMEKRELANEILRLRKEKEELQAEAAKAQPTVTPREPDKPKPPVRGQR